MTVLSLREYTPTPAVPLTAAQRDALASVVADIDITPTVGTEHHYDLRPGATIGVTHAGGLTIEIRPRLPLDRVLFLVSHAMEAMRWPADTVDLANAPSLVVAIGRMFLRLAEPTLAQGVLQGYVRVDDRLSTIRGRIRFADQISRWNGQAPPVEVTYEDFTVDVLENRLLKAAGRRIAALADGSPDTRVRLHRMDHLLADVSEVPFAGRGVPEVHWTRLNERYRPAVEMARLILASTGVESAVGGNRAPSLVFTMHEVFEQFVHVTLGRALGATGPDWPRNGRGRPLHLDERGRVPLKPDLSWWIGGRCVFVGDCKYKRTEVGTNADLYQLLAYLTATDLPAGVLVYAAGEAEPTHHVTRFAGKELHIHTLDLAGHPAAILAQVEHLADRIRPMIGGALVSSRCGGL